MSQIRLESPRVLPKLAEYRQKANQELLEIIGDISGPKGLVLDSTLADPLGLVVSVPELREQGVEKLLLLSENPFVTDLPKLIYLVRPDMTSMPHISSLIFANQSCSHHVYFIPRITTICRRILEEEGVAGSINFGEYHLDFIPYDEDVLSLAFPSALREFARGDKQSVYYLAHAINSLLNYCGNISIIHWIGERAKIASNLIVQNTGSDLTGSSDIGQLIIIDRSVDFISPLVSQLNYEGMLNEQYGIKHTVLSLDQGLRGRPQKVFLNSDDPLFADIRDMHMGEVGPFLQFKAREIAGEMEYRDLTMVELSKFTERLPSLHKEHISLATHISLVEGILKRTSGMNFRDKLNSELNMLSEGIASSEDIEELIHKEESILEVIRMMCLQWLTCGIRKLDYLEREFVETYGFEHLKTIEILERVGLLRKKPEISFSKLRKNLNLFRENFKGSIALVHSGYIPASIRMIEAALKPGFPLDSKIPHGSIGKLNKQSPRTILVCFIGGITHAEISSLRLLGIETQTNFVIGTTDILKPESFVSGIADLSDKMI